MAPHHSTPDPAPKESARTTSRPPQLAPAAADPPSPSSPRSRATTFSGTNHASSTSGDCSAANRAVARLATRRELAPRAEIREDEQVHAPPPVEVDEAELLARLGGRRDLLAMLVGLFSADLPQIHEEFTAALAAGDAAGVRRIAHRVVGTLANLSGGPLLEYGRDIEELSVPENLPILGPRIDAFRAALDELEQRLRKAFA
ncbi:Hpt domain-containing protein [Nannocystis pusilla]|uniref:Hpt domain-containing protein n=1 Tax=Nannocystis pusilla TaxID=889268 RepID=UPI003B7656A9